MRRGVFACFLMVVFGQICPLSAAAASTSVTIRTVQPYNLSVVNGSLTKTASHELVEVQNHSSETVNMTGWSLKYLSASSATSSPQSLRTITPNPGMQFALLPALSRDTFVSSAYATSRGLTTGLQFSSTLADTAGNVMLFNAFGQEIDRVGWRSGSSVNPKAEGEAVVLTSETSTMQRLGLDTDNNAVDFLVLPLSADPGYMFGGLYDANDLCANIEGIQESAPTGMIAYDDGTCASPDRCSNIPEVQLEVPEFYIRQADGTCVEKDVCKNIDKIQHTVPEGYEHENDNCLPAFIASNIIITELFPNPNGADAGNEFIELYNAGADTVNLSDYVLMMSGKAFHFPSAKLLLSETYVVFSDNELDVVFPNTAGVELSIVAKNGVVTSTMPAYSSAPTGQSWEVQNGYWSYSNQPTPGAENKPHAGEPVDEEDAKVLAPCASNQYRSVETNRCRLLSVSSASVTPCKEGQYRSEETNRCRSIAQTVAASLKPCSDDQFRNPATGRCKKIASTDDFLQPCDAGWERSSETNRCRKIKATSLPLAAFPVTQTDPSSGSFSMMVTVAAVVIGAMGYAVWEWRHEIAGTLSRFIKR